MSKVARWLTAATRPDISAKRQIPMMPTIVTQPRDRPKRAPTWALVTRSPMSTKPPMAVRIPRAMAKICFTGSPLPPWGMHELVLELLQPVGGLCQPSGQGGVPIGLAVDDGDPRGRHQAGRAVDLAGDRLVAHPLRLGWLPGADRVAGLAHALLGLHHHGLQVAVEHPPLDVLAQRQLRG